MKILILSVRPDEQTAINAWKDRHPDVSVTSAEWELHSDTVDQVEGYAGIVIQQRSLIEDDVYPRLHELGIKQITTRTAGFDVINLKAAAANGLAVSNVPAYSPRSVAELALTHTLRLIRKQELVDQRVHNQDFRWNGLQGAEIHSLTIGIIGAGRIGGTAARLFDALGAKVIANDIKPNHELDDVLTFKSLEEVLKQADVICLHVDLNETSKNLIDAHALSLMKPTAYLVNECRGPVVDTKALLAALKEGRLAGAALDTLVGEEKFFNFDLRGKELPSADLIGLRKLDNVIITPHVGFYTNIAVQNMIDISLDDTLAIISGVECEHVVQQAAQA
ncbi:D-lactate dehydrogenase [Ligilactobacillus salitolerans]|uniref:D-lactate dehydrogenase n=1 Tax=Ligilactobacillus salitolerans TaxID=1808352 RepID=A0A401IUH6_9LACO|nr:D-2-hydroxyacid dehydrogenase [Ligilactobacillus salitolerans]GBG95148.1 D-lactate dehydrogenase [Ligilactobacillus salitolerans]